MKSLLKVELGFVCFTTWFLREITFPDKDEPCRGNYCINLKIKVADLAPT